MNVKQPHPPVFEIFAHVVLPRIDFYKDDKRSEALSAIDFGTIFFGQSRSDSALLVNNSPTAVPFVVSVVVDRNSALNAAQLAFHADNKSGCNDNNQSEDGISPNDSDQQQQSAVEFRKEWEIDDGSLTVSPLEGLLEPYACQPVSFQFTPLKPPNDQTLKQTMVASSTAEAEESHNNRSKGKCRKKVHSRPYGYRVSITVPSAGEVKQQSHTQKIDELPPNNLDVVVTAQAAPITAVTMSPRTLRFGTCEVRSKQKALLTITNESYVPAVFQFARVAHFSVSPARGKISGNSETTVVVSYHPAQIGSFDAKCEFSVEGGLRTSFLRLVGKAIQNVPSAVCEQRSSRFVDGKGRSVVRDYIQDLLPGQSSWLGTTTIVDRSKADKAQFDYEEAHHLELFQERAQRDMNRLQYIQYLRRRRAKREATAAKVAEETRVRHAKRNRSDPNGVDLGLEGLEEPPLLPLPDASKEPLWCSKSSGKCANGRSAAGVLDPDKLIVEKFKPRPTTQAEMRHCETRLGAAELAQVIPSHTTLDFGRICIGSKVVKSFAVNNELAHAIIVEMNTSTLPLELAASKSTASQVIPAGATAGFDIAIISDSEAIDYHSFVQFVINNRHQLKLNVTAEVVPVKLVPSCKDITIQFDSSSLEPSANAEISLANPGNCDVEFVWTAQSPFTITPDHGSVPAYGTSHMVITWTPTPAFRNTCKLRLHVPGAKQDIELVATGKIEDGRCAFTDKRVDFGTVSVGTSHQVTVTLNSVGTGPAACTIELPNDASDYLALSTSRFIIPASGSQDILLTFKPRAQRDLDGIFLACHVRGAKTVRLPIVGMAIIPDISVLRATPESVSGSKPIHSLDVARPKNESDGFVQSTPSATFDFGSLFVGYEQRELITLQNDSEIAACLVLDMGSHTEFYIEPCSGTSPNGSFPAGDSTNNSNGASDSVSPPSKKSIIEPASDLDILSSSARESRWSIGIAPKDKLSFELVFNPQSPGTFEFDLSLQLCDSYKHDIGRVRGVALRPMLVVSSTTVDFGERILVGDSTRQLPITEEITLLNQHDETLDWQLSEGTTDQQRTEVPLIAKIFYVSPKMGKLAPGELATVRITFAPVEACEYKDRFHLSFESDQSLGNALQQKQSSSVNPTLMIQVRGIGANPRLEVEDPHERDGYIRGPGDVFVLPTVPLGVKSRVRFYVRNCGFESIQLKYRLPPHIPVTIDVDFPDGRALGVATPKVAVVISFSSDTPVSFASALQLLDTDGNIYMVPIAGAADNCILSTHAFLDSYHGDYVFHTSEGAPPKIVNSSLARQLIEKDLLQKEAQRATRKRSQTGSRVQKQSSQANQSQPSAVASVDTPRASQDVDLVSMGKGETEIGIDLRKPRPTPGAAVAPLLVLWLNYHALNSQKGMDQPMRIIPDDIVATHGRPAIDAIEALSGRKVPNRVSQKQTLCDDKDLLAQLMLQYEALLLFLKERGALLNTVRPEQLLSRQHYVKFREKQADPTHSKSRREVRRAVWDSSYSLLSREAWLTVLLQAVRVFSLTRITPKTFASLPGVLLPKSTRPNAERGLKHTGRDGVESEFSGSNVYSSGECILLKWLGYHIANGAGPSTAHTRHLKRFDDAFSDGISLCQILLSHSPSLGDRGGPLDQGKATGDKKPKELPRRAKDGASVDVAEVSRLENATRAARSLNALRSDLLADVDIRTAHLPAGSLAEPAELLDLSGLRAMLFALHLYLTLPNFVPKTTIEYNATLGEPMCKMIELQNSASREIMYEVIMEGSTDFRPKCMIGDASGNPSGKTQQQQLVVIEAKSSNAYGVELVPRFSKPVEARLTFFAIPGNYPGLRTPSMVFILRSAVENAAPLQVVEIETAAYEQRTINIDVENPFKAPGVFSVTLKNIVLKEYALQRRSTSCSTHRASIGLDQKTGRSDVVNMMVKSVASSLNREGGHCSGEPTAQASAPAVDLPISGVGENTDDARALALLREPFWTDQSTLKLDKNPSTLRVQLLPTSPGIFKAEIRLLDNEIGELALEIRANVSAPKPLDCFKFSVEASNDMQVTVPKILRLPPINPLLDRALTALSERISLQSDRQPVRVALQKISRGVFHNASHGVKPVTYEVHANSPFFRTPDDVLIDLVGESALETAKVAAAHQSAATCKALVGPTTPGGLACSKPIKKPELVDAGEETQQQHLGASCMLIQFYPQKAGTYQCTVMCRAHLCGGLQDIRVVNFEVVVTLPKVQTLLEFKAPARRSITQDLPIVNSSDADWNLVAQFSGSRVFSGPSKLRVPARGKSHYSLTFAPTWIGKDLLGKLVLRNPRSNEVSFEYSLSGEGEPPLAEGHVVIRCNARDTASHNMRITNTAKEPRTYAVESDLAFVSGKSNILVPPHESADYEIRVTPSLGGAYTGSIYFNSNSGEYCWYTIKVEVDSPLEESVIEISTVVRQAASARISLANPLDQAVVFDVLLQGDGLLGESKFTLQALEEAGTYEIFYTPLIAQTHSGSVAFLNDVVGEFWYKLNLSAARAEPTTLGEMECSVGARVSTKVTVENPLNQEITLISRCSNRINFAVEPEIIISPYGTASVEIFYAPSEIDVLQTCEITLHHPALGDWEYVATGRGMEPGIMNEHAPSAVIGEPASYMFPFRNPFAIPLDIDVTLSDIADQRLVVDPDKPPLQLLMRRTRGVPLAPHTSISIPLSFEPAVIAEHHATIKISGEYAGRRLIWTFPVRGVVNAPLQIREVSIAAKAKTSIRHDIQLRLTALAELSSDGETFDFEIVSPPEVAAIVQRSLTIVPIDTHLASADSCLKFQALFEPHKPFNASVNLVIKRQTGGRWPFEIQLDSLYPEPDDVIHLESNLHNTSTVTFRLKSNNMGYAPFSAFFSTGSSNAFTVSPSSGVLPPANSDGMPLNVSFSPVRYGMLQRGLLIVETDNIIWTYDVHGSHPTFIIPNAQSKVDSHLSKKFIKQRRS